MSCPPLFAKQQEQSQYPVSSLTVNASNAAKASWVRCLSCRLCLLEPMTFVGALGESVDVIDRSGPSATAAATSQPQTPRRAAPGRIKQSNPGPSLCSRTQPRTLHILACLALSGRDPPLTHRAWLRLKCTQFPGSAHALTGRHYVKLVCSLRNSAGAERSPPAADHQSWHIFGPQTAHPRAYSYSYSDRQTLIDAPVTQ